MIILGVDVVILIVMAIAIILTTHYILDRVLYIDRYAIYVCDIALMSSLLAFILGYIGMVWVLDHMI